MLVRAILGEKLHCDTNYFRKRNSHSYVYEALQQYIHVEAVVGRRAFCFLVKQSVPLLLHSYAKLS